MLLNVVPDAQVNPLTDSLAPMDLCPGSAGGFCTMTELLQDTLVPCFSVNDNNLESSEIEQ
jgi:hypothetical protein